MSNEIPLFSQLQEYLNNWTPWMVWRAEVFIFLISFFIFLGIIAVLDLKRRSRPRKGFLPIPTTRGDRIFIGTVVWIIVMLVITAINFPWYLILIIGIPFVILILSRG